MSISLMEFLKSWGATAVFFLVVDSIFLGIIARDFYASQLGDLMKDRVNLPIAALFYIFFSAAVVYLASMRGMDGGTWTTTLFAGALLGFAAYGTYDVTNLATLKNWPVVMSVVDVLWGTAITASAALVGYLFLPSQ